MAKRETGTGRIEADTGAEEGQAAPLAGFGKVLIRYPRFRYAPPRAINHRPVQGSGGGGIRAVGIFETGVVVQDPRHFFGAVCF